jgi:hypothetical protein
MSGAHTRLAHKRDSATDANQAPDVLDADIVPHHIREFSWRRQFGNEDVLKLGAGITFAQ